VSLAQLVGTMHNICKVRGSNPDHHKEKKILGIFFFSKKLLAIAYVPCAIITIGQEHFVMKEYYNVSVFI